MGAIFFTPSEPACRLLDKVFWTFSRHGCGALARHSAASCSRRCGLRVVRPPRGSGRCEPEVQVFNYLRRLQVISGFFCRWEPYCVRLEGFRQTEASYLREACCQWPARTVDFRVWGRRLPHLSADGRQIAFCRSTLSADERPSVPSGVYIVPALGGADREVGENCEGVSWSPDGKRRQWRGRLMQLRVRVV